MMPKSSAQRMKEKRERDYNTLLDSNAGEKKLSDTGLIEIIGVCYRKAKQSGNTAVLKIAMREFNRRIELIEQKENNPQ